MNNLWGNSNREVRDASDVTKVKKMKTIYENVKKNTDYIITNKDNYEDNDIATAEFAAANHSYGIGYNSDMTEAAILTSRSYADKYNISKGKFCYCNDNDNIDYLKYEAKNGNKLQIKYKRPEIYYEQILFTGNLYSINDERTETYDMIQDPSIDDEGFIIKMNHNNWNENIADISYNESKSFKSEAKLNPINNRNFTIKGPIVL